MHFTAILWHISQLTATMTSWYDFINVYNLKKNDGHARAWCISLLRNVVLYDWKYNISGLYKCKSSAKNLLFLIKHTSKRYVP